MVLNMSLALHYNSSVLRESAIKIEECSVDATHDQLDSPISVKSEVELHDDHNVNSSYLSSQHETSVVLNVFQCDVCKKEFNWKSSFQQHLKVHSTTKDYKCQQCRSQFTLKGSLTKHIRSVHDKIKPFK